MRYAIAGLSGARLLPGRSGALAVAVLVLSTSACNTVAALGEDVQAAGNALSDTAEDVKE